MHLVRVIGTGGHLAWLWAGMSAALANMATSVSLLVEEHMELVVEHTAW
jgi:hypothetical protein